MTAIAATIRSRLRAFACILGLVLAFAPTLHADPVQDRRVSAGLRLFKAMLAADLDLERRLDEGRLLVVFYYIDDPGAARELAERFQGDNEGGKVRNLPVTVIVADAAGLAELGDRKPAGIFLAEPPADKALMALIKSSADRKTILYSPFEGHVEKGVLGGIAVEAQVRPYVNRRALEASGIRLKTFFLKVTKVYE